MLHVLTNFRNAPKYIRNPKLELIAKFSKFGGCSDDLSNFVMKEIDGAYLIKGKVVQTPFGVTTVDNLSLGCQSLLVALKENDGNTWISFLGAGDNVIELALKICRDYDIDLYIVLDRSPFIYPEEYTFEINGKIYKDADFMDVMFDVLYEEGEYDD